MGNGKKLLPKISGISTELSGDSLGHVVLASAAHYLTHDALDGRRKYDGGRCFSDDRPYSTARPSPRTGGGLSARLGQKALPQMAMTAQSFSATSGAATARERFYPRVHQHDYGRTEEDRSWILRQIELKASSKFKTVREAFRFVDADRDGHVDKEELRYFFRSYGFGPQVSDGFFDFLDVDGSGELNYDDFINYFRPHIVRGVHGNRVPELEAQQDFIGSDAGESVATTTQRLDPALRTELRMLMQDIGRKLPLKFKHSRDAFRTLDLDRNGRITRAEMRGFFRGFGYAEDISDRVFDLLLEKETGDVNFAAFMAHFDKIIGPQFRQAKRTPLIPVPDSRQQNEVEKVVRAIQERMTTKYRNVTEAFRDVDLNKDGSIDRYEMGIFLKKLGHERSADKFFDALDENGDASISYDEFAALCGESQNHRRRA
jgi:Ca2+-binding EF-hand superfamily protein